MRLGDVEHVRQLQSRDQLGVEHPGLVVEPDTLAVAAAARPAGQRPWSASRPERKIPALSSMVDCIASRRSAIRSVPRSGDRI